MALTNLICFSLLLSALEDRGYQVTLNAGWTNSPVEPADVVALCKRHNYNIAYIGLQEVSGRRRIAQIAYQLQQVTKRTFSYVITKVNTSKRPEYVALIWDTSRFTWKATIAPHDASMKAQGYLLEDTDGALRTVIVAHWSHKKTSFDKWVERCHYKSWLATMNSPTILLADFNCTPSDISNSLGVPEDRLALTEGDPATTSGGTGPIDNVVVPFGYHTTNSTVEDVGSSDHHAVLTRFKKN